MKVIGLTGGTGSGKSVISTFLKCQGAYVVDADKISHEIIEKGRPAYTAIVEYFGMDILDEKLEIERKKLGAVVFADTEKLNYLNDCTHRFIYQEMEKQIAEYKMLHEEGTILLDVPLFNHTLAAMCDEVWVVYAKEEIRIQRIVARDSISYEQAKNRVQSQKSFDYYENFATHILDNNQDAMHLTKQVIALLQKDGKELECRNLGD